MKINSVSSYAGHSTGRAAPNSPELPPSRWGREHGDAGERPAAAARHETASRPSREGRRHIIILSAAGGTLEKTAAMRWRAGGTANNTRGWTVNEIPSTLGGYDHRWIKHLRMLLIPRPGPASLLIGRIPHHCLASDSAAAPRAPAGLPPVRRGPLPGQRHVTAAGRSQEPPDRVGAVGLQAAVNCWLDNKYCKVPQTAGCELVIFA